MSKYSPERLKEMAQEWVVEHTAGSEKAFRLVMVISIMTGLAPEEVVERIEAMADA